mmetsp:Transcript_6691/g.8456  ORF Transcript_6691/g.8456 Transcript_6691/m.8456 type:complete len:156 (-) Transcript_6691:28-495(-)
MTSKAKPITTPNQSFEGDVTVMKSEKGRNVSNRSWKVRPQKRASSLITKTTQNAASKSWEKKKAERDAKKALLEREKELKENKRQAAIKQKELRLEQEKRRMENEFRAASRSAQVLGKNADFKMKSMNKKQLRQIKKTRLNTKTGAVEFVSAYEK